MVTAVVDAIQQPLISRSHRYVGAAFLILKAVGYLVYSNCRKGGACSEMPKLKAQSAICATFSRFDPAILQFDLNSVLTL